MTLPLPTDYTRCLGHPRDHTARAAPNTWCEHIKTCARHQTISFDNRALQTTVIPRLCVDLDKSFYIEVVK
jgi:hypothetical protein